MSDATVIQASLQEQLVKAIEQQADICEIEGLLKSGAVANDSSVMQAVEEHAVGTGEPWGEALFALPQMAEAWRLRQVADQAAYDLVDSLEENDVYGVMGSLQEMVDAGDDANTDLGDGTLLAIAVQNRCDPKIIKALIELGKADPEGFSSDAVEALDDVDDGPWKTEVLAIFRTGRAD